MLLEVTVVLLKVRVRASECDCCAAIGGGRPSEGYQKEYVLVGVR